MIDSFVLYAPLLLLPVVALVAFVGCDIVFGLDHIDDPLMTPTGFTATPGNNKVVLSWDPVDNAKSYLVKRGTVPGMYQAPFDPTTDTTFPDDTAINGTTYFYVVIAIAGSGYNDSGPSAEVEATPSAAALIPFIKSVMAMDLVTSATAGWYGMQIQVGTNDVLVQQLGRIFVAGNSRIHVIKIVNSAGMDEPMGFVSVSMAGGTENQFVYAPLNPPKLLSAGQTYFIVSDEQPGMDAFYNHTATVTITDNTVATLTSAARGGPPFVTDSTQNKPYGVVNFLY